MEPVTMIFVFMLGMATGDMHMKQEARLDEQAAKVEELDNTTLSLAGSHAASSARGKVTDAALQSQIDSLRKQIHQLSRDIESLVPGC